jgi:hypothetical protein
MNKVKQEFFSTSGKSCPHFSSTSAIKTTGQKLGENSTNRVTLSVTWISARFRNEGLDDLARLFS